MATYINGVLQGGTQAQNPQPQSGAGAFGGVPGAIGLPNPYGDISSVYPNLDQTNAGVSGDILSKLGGTLSPGTENALKNASATFGLKDGMPNSGLSWNQLYGNIAGAIEGQQQEGIQDYNATLPVVSRTQTVSPETQVGVAEQNAVNASAPNPAASASYAEQLYQKYLGSMGGPAGGTGAFGAGGFGAPVSTRTGQPSEGSAFTATPGGASGIPSSYLDPMSAIPTGNMNFNTNPADDLSGINFPSGYDPFAPAGSGGIWGDPAASTAPFDWSTLGGSVDNSGG